LQRIYNSEDKFAEYFLEQPQQEFHIISQTVTGVYIVKEPDQVSKFIKELEVSPPPQPPKEVAVAKEEPASEEAEEEVDDEVKLLEKQMEEMKLKLLQLKKK